MFEDIVIAKGIVCDVIATPTMDINGNPQNVDYYWVEPHNSKLEPFVCRIDEMEIPADLINLEYDLGTFRLLRE